MQKKEIKITRTYTVTGCDSCPYFDKDLEDLYPELTYYCYHPDSGKYGMKLDYDDYDYAGNYSSFPEKGCPLLKEQTND